MRGHLSRPCNDMRQEWYNEEDRLMERSRGSKCSRGATVGLDGTELVLKNCSQMSSLRCMADWNREILVDGALMSGLTGELKG